MTQPTSWEQALADTEAGEYDFLEDPQERAWLTAVKPQEVLANAHRMYDWMAETGMGPESFIRELAFTKAATALGLDYDVLYLAWLDETPAQVAS